MTNEPKDDLDTPIAPPQRPSTAEDKDPSVTDTAKDREPPPALRSFPDYPDSDSDS